MKKLAEATVAVFGVGGVGGSAIIAGAFGAGDTEKAKNVSSLCFYSAIALGAVTTVLLFTLQTPLLRLLGTKPEMWDDSRTYMLILSCGTVFMLIYGLASIALFLVLNVVLFKVTSKRKE